jgi:hypothetical protein
MKKIFIRISVVIVALVLLALVVVFFSLNSIVKKGVETVGPMLTKVDVKLSSADISPFSGSGSLSKFFVGNPDGYKTPSAIQVGSVKVGVGVGSVFSDTIVINEVSLKDAEITLEGSLSGNNLTQILDNLKGSGNAETKATAETPASGGAKKTAKKFILKDFVIEGAKLNLSLTLPVVGGKSLTVPLPPVHVQNIGVAENGVTADQLAEAIMKPLLASATEAAKDAVANMGGQLKDLGGKGAKSLTDMFKK